MYALEALAPLLSVNFLAALAVGTGVLMASDRLVVTAAARVRAARGPLRRVDTRL